MANRWFPPIWDNYKRLSSSEQDTVKLWLFIGMLVFMGLVTALLS